jgi:hypothetical protein
MKPTPNPNFTGEFNIGLEESPDCSLILCRAGKDFFKNMHKAKANQLLWNIDKKSLYYLNNERVLFEVLFKEVPTSSVPSVSSVVK